MSRQQYLRKFTDDVTETFRKKYVMIITVMK